MTSVPARPEIRPPLSMTLQQWLQQGEVLYQATVQDYRALEVQLDDLERRLAAKQTEVNQIASMLGKPPINNTRRVTAEIITPESMPVGADRPASLHDASTSATIARALSGKSVSRPPMLTATAEPVRTL